MTKVAAKASVAAAFDALFSGNLASGHTGAPSVPRSHSPVTRSGKQISRRQALARLLVSAGAIAAPVFVGSRKVCAAGSRYRFENSKALHVHLDVDSDALAEYLPDWLSPSFRGSFVVAQTAEHRLVEPVVRFFRQTSLWMFARREDVTGRYYLRRWSDDDLVGSLPWVEATLQRADIVFDVGKDVVRGITSTKAQGDLISVSAVIGGSPQQAGSWPRPVFAKRKTFPQSTSLLRKTPLKDLTISFSDAAIDDPLLRLLADTSTIKSDALWIYEINREHYSPLG